MPPLLKQELQPVGDILSSSLQSQDRVIQSEALEYRDGMGDATADLECQPTRPPGGEEGED